jgi:hypothetical protein
MGDHPKQTFDPAALWCSALQGRSEATLVLGEGAFGVPTPTIQPAGKAGMHGSSVTAGGTDMLVSGSATIHGDDGRADAQFFTGQPMVRFRVVAGVSEEAIDGNVPNRLRHHRHKVDGIIAGTVSGRCRGDQVSGMMCDHGQFRVPSVSLHATGTHQKVAADVVTFQSRGVNRGLGPFLDQAALFRNTENSLEESLKSPFFRSRSCAF